MVSFLEVEEDLQRNASTEGHAQNLGGEGVGLLQVVSVSSWS